MADLREVESHQETIHDSDGGIAILFFGFAYIKVHMPTRSSSPYRMIAGILYLFIGIFGVLIGLGTGLAAFP